MWPKHGCTYACFHDTWLPSWVYLTNRGHAAGLLCALWQHCDQEPPLSRDCTSNSTRNPASRGKFHLPPLTPACFVVQVLATVEQHAMRHKRYIKPILSLSVDFYVSLHSDFALCSPSSCVALPLSHTRIRTCPDSHLCACLPRCHRGQAGWHTPLACLPGVCGRVHNCSLHHPVDLLPRLATPRYPCSALAASLPTCSLWLELEARAAVHGLPLVPPYPNDAPSAATSLR